jgi:chromosome condensin MukBEF ATPase and DNA-binding subunit MukB
MSDDGIEALLRAARRVAAGEVLSSDLLNDEKVPARLRLVLAATALVAADKPASKRAIVHAAPASWSAVYRNHAELLDDIKKFLPELVASQLALAGSAPTATALRQQLDEANASINRERKRRQEIEQQLHQVRQYAMELHRRLKPEFDAAVRERAEKVRSIHPVP